MNSSASTTSRCSRRDDGGKTNLHSRVRSSWLAQSGALRFREGEPHKPAQSLALRQPRLCKQKNHPKLRLGAGRGVYIALAQDSERGIPFERMLGAWAMARARFEYCVPVMFSKNHPLTPSLERRGATHEFLSSLRRGVAHQFPSSLRRGPGGSEN